MTPAGTSNELDVQNGWEENTHTHTHLYEGLFLSLSQQAQWGVGSRSILLIYDLSLAVLLPAVCNERNAEFHTVRGTSNNPDLGCPSDLDRSARNDDTLSIRDKFFFVL